MITEEHQITEQHEEQEGFSLTLREPGMLAWVHLMRVFHKVQRREMAHLSSHGLTIAQFDVLVQLSREEGITQQTLADRLLVTKGNVCGLLDRMTEAGLLERRADPDDRRANMLHLTPAGRKLADHVFPTHQALIVAVMGTLAPAEQRTLGRLLGRLDRSLGEE